jgi:hypothetical protein
VNPRCSIRAAVDVDLVRHLGAATPDLLYDPHSLYGDERAVEDNAVPGAVPDLDALLIVHLDPGAGDRMGDDDELVPGERPADPGGGERSARPDSDIGAGVALGAKRLLRGHAVTHRKRR